MPTYFVCARLSAISGCFHFDSVDLNNKNINNLGTFLFQKFV